MMWLKRGISLLTFAEGTRSKDGRMAEFRRGAFKMASTTGTPIVPMSIVGTNAVNPNDFVFPVRSGRKIMARVVFHDPVETVGVEEGDLVEMVRARIIEGLPYCQRPST